MSEPPAKKDEESNTISMVVERWGRGVQLSTIQHINGYPWCLGVIRDGAYSKLSIICTKSDEAYLWKCTAKINVGYPFNCEKNHTFESWNTDSHIIDTDWKEIPIGSKIEVKIATEEDGKSWRRRSYLDPAEPRNGTLVVGDEKKKIQVNKEYLSAQSPFFDRLFNGDFKEKNMDEIPIGGVEYEELSNILKLVCGEQGASLTDENVLRSLELADRFSFNIEDSVVSYLLSPSCSFSFGNKLLLSEQLNLTFLKEILLVRNTTPQLLELCRSNDWNALSEQTRKALFEATCDHKRPYFVLEDKIHGRKIKPPSAKKNKGSNAISMVVEEWKDDQTDQFSSVQRINGYPWRLRFSRLTNNSSLLYLICDKSKEASLWQCNGTVTLQATNISRKFKFGSWKSVKVFITKIQGKKQIEMHIETEEDGESWTACPFVDPLKPHDGILLLGEEKKKFTVDKKSLAMASSFFGWLFNGDFMGKSLNEIPIRDVKYEEFSNVIMIAYQSEGAFLTDVNVRNVLQLADKFDLKIVKDYAANFLLKNSRISLAQKLIMAEEYRLSLLKAVLLDQYHYESELKMLCKSPEWNDLPKETIRVIFEKMCTRC